MHGQLYGTSFAAVKQVLDSGKVCILDIDVQGARQVRQSGQKAIYVFIAPPSLEELEIRLRRRGTESEEQVQRRLNQAKTEIRRYYASLGCPHNSSSIGQTLVTLTCIVYLDHHIRPLAVCHAHNTFLVCR